MGRDGLTVYPYRIIPCDLGHDLDHARSNRIQSTLDSSKKWRITTESNTSSGALFRAQLVVSDDRYEIHLELFEDGIAIFTLVDSVVAYDDIEGFDPEEIVRTRRDAHDSLLGHDHAVSEILDREIKRLRNFFDSQEARFSSASDWENGGLSYVFSFYFIDTNKDVVNSEEFRDKLVFLIFAEEARRSLDFAERMETNREQIKEKLRTRFLGVIEEDHDPIPQVHTCASWSNVLIIGSISEEVKSTYWQLERGLQHTWFYTYITDEFIDRKLESISEETPKQELEELDKMLNQMMFNINEYQGVTDSTLSERDFRLYKALVETSRLNRLIDNAEEKADLLRNRYNWLLQEKRVRGNKRIDFILFIIFIATLVGQYRSFISLGVYLIPIIGVTVLVAVYLYTPFFEFR